MIKRAFFLLFAPTRLVLAGLCSACMPAPAGERAPDSEIQAVRTAPHRIVSLDLCADQYVLKFVQRQDILAVSPDAGKSFSAMRNSAAGLRTVRPRMEDVLALRPDLVVRSYGGGAESVKLLEDSGIEVIQLGYPQDLGGVRDEIVRIGSALGNAGLARKIAHSMDQRLATLKGRAVSVQGAAPSALYITPGGVTAGPGTLMDGLFHAAGLANFQQRPGWNTIPLEHLAYDSPDMLAIARFDGAVGSVDAWSTARHPLVQDSLKSRPVVLLDSGAVACADWSLADAAEALASGREGATGKKVAAP
ncbi:MAG: ABC transporter substrate-binding protein [Sphingomonadaceae bacterium]